MVEVFCQNRAVNLASTMAQKYTMVQEQPSAYAMSPSDTNEEIDHLEAQLNDLASLCNRLRLENRSLREQQVSLVEERARLIEKNELARTKVEQMIVRLKSLEATS